MKVEDCFKRKGGLKDGGCRIALGVFIYSFALGIMIWATVEANTNPGNYEAFIIKRGYFNYIAGIILGIGFLPVILIILVVAIFIFIVSFSLVFSLVLLVCYFLLLGFLKLLSCCNCPFSKILYDAVAVHNHLSKKRQEYMDTHSDDSDLPNNCAVNLIIFFGEKYLNWTESRYI